MTRRVWVVGGNDGTDGALVETVVGGGGCAGQACLRSDEVLAVLVMARPGTVLVDLWMEEPAGPDLYAEMRRLDGTEHGERSVAGEEKIVADMIGDEQRRDAGVPPDDAGRRRERAETLADLSHREENDDGEKRCKGGAENSRANKCEAEQINEDRTGD